MGLLSWIIFGGLVGWIATILTKQAHQTGILENIVIGLVGAALGGFVANELLGIGSVRTFTIEGFVIAILGATALLVLLSGIRKNQD